MEQSWKGMMMQTSKLASTCRNYVKNHARTVLYIPVAGCGSCVLSLCKTFKLYNSRGRPLPIVLCIVVCVTYISYKVMVCMCKSSLNVLQY